MGGAEASVLDALVSIIKDIAEPDRIIFFGSRTTGSARPDSDYVFLIVVRQLENERHVSRRIYCAAGPSGRCGHRCRGRGQGHAGAAPRHLGLIYRQALEEGQIAYDPARA
jgi:hypothetical protein